MGKIIDFTVAAGRIIRQRTIAALACKRGEGYIDVAVRVLIAVVLGALLLAGLYLLFNSTVLPNVTQRIKELFNYTG